MFLTRQFCLSDVGEHHEGSRAGAVEFALLLLDAKRVFGWGSCVLYYVGFDGDGVHAGKPPSCTQGCIDWSPMSCVHTG